MRSTSFICVKFRDVPCALLIRGSWRLLLFAASRLVHGGCSEGGRAEREGRKTGIGGGWEKVNKDGEREKVKKRMRLGWVGCVLARIERGEIKEIDKIR